MAQKRRSRTHPRITPKEAYRRLETSLVTTDEKLATEFASGYSVALNSDGTIDGELTADVPRGVDPDNVILAMTEFFRRPKGSGFWVSFGLVVPPSAYTKRREYERFGRKVGATTYYTRLRNFAHASVTGRDIAYSFKKIGSIRKIQSIFLRVYWSPDGSRPD